MNKTSKNVGYDAYPLSHFEHSWLTWIASMKTANKSDLDKG